MCFFDHFDHFGRFGRFGDLRCVNSVNTHCFHILSLNITVNINIININILCFNIISSLNAGFTDITISITAVIALNLDLPISHHPTSYLASTRAARPSLSE